VIEQAVLAAGVKMNWNGPLEAELPGDCPRVIESLESGPCLEERARTLVILGNFEGYAQGEAHK
jgi:hypothetical protein